MIKGVDDLTSRASQVKSSQVIGFFECERLFSAAGRMIAPLRSRLDANTIGMAQTLRSWLRAGLIDELDPILLSVKDNRGDEGNGDNTNATEFAREEAGWE